MQLKPVEAKWFDYREGVKLKLKWIPLDLNEEMGYGEYFMKVVQDWKGFKDFEGNDVPCTKSMKAWVLTETEDGKELLTWVIVKMQSVSTFLDLEGLKKKLIQEYSGNGPSQKQPSEAA